MLLLMMVSQITLQACCHLHHMAAVMKGNRNSVTRVQEQECKVLNCGAKEDIANPPSRNPYAAA